MHHVDGDLRGGVGPAGGVLEHPAAADRGQLMPVADERDPGAVLVGDREQGAGGVLVEHPGLIDTAADPRAPSRNASPGPE